MNLRPFVLAAFCSLVISHTPCSVEALGPASGDKEQLSFSDRYQGALSVDPDNPILHYSLGAALLAEGLDNEAVAEFSRAYPTFIDSAEMNYNLGLAHSRSGDPDSALLYFDRAETLGALEQPGLFLLANAYFNLALTCLEADGFEEAAGLFAKTLALDSHRQEIHRLLGETFARDGKTERALDEFDAYLRVYPDDATTREYVYTLYFNQAQKFMESGDREAAINAFDKALAANPGSPLAIYYLGYLDYSEGRFEEATDRLTRIYHTSPLEIRQSMDTILYNSALALLEQRKLRDAQAAIAPLTSNEPAALKDLYLAGNIHLILKEFEQARVCFERVLTLDPVHRGANLNMVAARAGAIEELFAQGRALFLQGEYKAARENLEAALDIHPAHPGVRVCLEETRSEIEEAAAAFFKLAEELIQQGSPEEALTHIKAGLNLAPRSPLGLELQELVLSALTEKLSEALERGIGLAKEGLLREADTAFARVLQLDSDNVQAQEARVKIAHLLEEKASEFAVKGTMALEDGRLSDAREAFDTALKFVPEMREGREGLARIDILLTAMASEEVQWGRRARSAGRLHQAREHFAGALRLRDDPDLRAELEAIDRTVMETFGALTDAAWGALGENDFRRAADFFESALALSPQNPDALNGLLEVEHRSAAVFEGELAAAEEYLASSNYPLALSRYRRALEIAPGNKKARKGLTYALKRMEGDLARLLASGEEALAGGLADEAEKAFREALMLDPFRREALAGLRRLEQLSDRGIEETDESHYYRQGIELYTRGKYKEAATAWEKLLTLSPRHEKASIHIEIVRRKLRQIEEAKGRTDAGQAPAGSTGRGNPVPVQPVNAPDSPA